jgi:SAM-dependent methyltransferase
MNDDRLNPVGAYAYFEDYHWWFLARRRIMQELVRNLLPPSPDSLVVDIGCGPGANLASLAAAYPCVGIDASEDAIAVARSRYPMIKFICGYSPGDLGPVAQSARLFLVMDVLEHVEDDRKLLRSLVASSAPGAYFLITVPADPGLWSAHDEAVGHYRRYTAASLARVWGEMPMEPLLVSPYNARLYWLVKAVRTVNRTLHLSRRGDASEGTDLRVPRTPFNGVLTALFSNEAMALGRALQNRSSAPYARGVSLIAITRRKEGSVVSADTDIAAGALTEKELAQPPS